MWSRTLRNGSPFPAPLGSDLIDYGGGGKILLLVTPVSDHAAGPGRERRC